MDRAFGSLSAGLTVLASGPRFDSTSEDPATRLGGYAVVDARVRYAIDKRWSIQLTGKIRPSGRLRMLLRTPKLFA